MRKTRCRQPSMPSLPYPENQLVSLAHSLVARGIIDEAELKQRLTSYPRKARGLTTSTATVVGSVRGESHHHPAGQPRRTKRGAADCATSRRRASRHRVCPGSRSMCATTEVRDSLMTSDDDGSAGGRVRDAVDAAVLWRPGALRHAAVGKGVRRRGGVPGDRIGAAAATENRARASARLGWRTSRCFAGPAISMRRRGGSAGTSTTRRWPSRRSRRSGTRRMQWCAH